MLTHLRNFFSGTVRHSENTDSILQLTEITGGMLKGRKMLLGQKRAVWQKMASGEFEDFIYKPLTENLPSTHCTIWDVGGHIGYHTLCFAALVGERGRVVCFEPNFFNMEQIERNLKQNSDLAQRVILDQRALSDIDGTAELVQSSNIGNTLSSWSYLDSATPPNDLVSYKSFKRVKIKTCKGDTLVATGQIPQPDIIKIDVEGAENLVLLGCQNLLQSARPLLFIEIHSVLTSISIVQTLCKFGYGIQILFAESSPPMRCFILAKPTIQK